MGWSVTSKPHKGHRADGGVKSQNSDPGLNGSGPALQTYKTILSLALKLPIGPLVPCGDGHSVFSKHVGHYQNMLEPRCREFQCHKVSSQDFIWVSCQQVAHISVDWSLHVLGQLAPVTLLTPMHRVWAENMAVEHTPLLHQAVPLL